MTGLKPRDKIGGPGVEISRVQSLGQYDPDRPPIKELRLALVCYGGVSLAIYMHGITKEIHKLVTASKGLEESPEQDPFHGQGTESVYWGALKGLRDEPGIPTRVAEGLLWMLFDAARSSRSPEPYYFGAFRNILDEERVNLQKIPKLFVELEELVANGLARQGHAKSGPR
jgi:hypothetical protein